MSLLRRSSATCPSVCGLIPGTPGWKRTVDLTFCAGALPLLALSTFAAAVVMSVTSPGPIFFRHERVGFMGRRFQLYRFRTLHVGADTPVSRAQGRQEPKGHLQPGNIARCRSILGGWFIRTSGLAGLPQILNVLRGEMSLVGPRPSHPFEYERSSALERRRFHCLPGMTGYVQASAARDLSTDRSVDLELHYVAHRSSGLDAAILLKSISVVVARVVNAVRSQRTVPPRDETHPVSKPPVEPFELK
jgi:lipopolysaccharide/colanic/teichoic acid biosynthesis glycosyltransferase